MPEFYERMAATANRLITKRGRDLRLVRLDQDAGDTQRPWWGPGDNPNEQFLPLKGVFVPPGTVRQFGLQSLGLGTEIEDMIAWSEQIIIVAQGENDLRLYKEVDDGGVRWGVVASQILKPGTTTLLGFIGVRR
ncbi:MAG: hypothetical protein Tp138OMZ00d2C19078261_72 [Prokaryotic dsDNA virus sp.]|nr:MAG: hypothetical protein Tp138OMZ00d2C19078261_72 [Prokaryotic dsDNA virus sp.]